MNQLLLSCLLLSLFSINSVARAQFPEPLPEHKIVQMDVGTWNATVTTWTGPDGKTDPNAAPTVSKGTETNRKLGAFWVISEFKGDFAGMAFEGHSVSGYDPKMKKFVGSWTDSFSPNPMHMTGTYDAKSKTLTSSTKGVGMTGEAVLGKSVMQYNADGTRSLTMYDIVDGKELKSMHIEYVRSK